MADQIEIDVRVTGADQAAQGVERVADALDHEKQAATGAATATRAVEASVGQAGTSMTSMAQRGQQLTQRVQGVSSAIQQLVSATGSTDRTASLIGGIAGATAQFAAMGSALGPGGALAGGLAGLVSGLAGVAAQATAARIAITALHTATAAVTSDLGAALGDIGHLNEADVERLMSEGAAERRTLMAREAELLETARDVWSGPSTRLEAVAELSRVRGEIEVLTSRINQLNAATGVGTETITAGGGPVGLELLTGSGRSGPAARGGGGGGRAARDTRWDGAAMSEEALDLYTSDISDREIERRRARDEEFAAADAERFEATLEMLAAEEEARKEADAERIEAEQEKHDAIAEMNSERLEKEQEAEEAAREQAIAQQEEFMQLGMNVVGMMTDALGEIASGEKTAEEAFRGLAKSFLQMISQYAALKAATEFADAIASFARYDFGGGAAHVAAGVAFTAVAVATGVGAAMINTSKPSAPARPEAEKSGNGKGGGDTIINWNSPVVTASTRDDLGRELGAMVDAGRARYG